MAFFKKDGEQLLQTEGDIHTPDNTLLASDKDSYTYPVEGWYWFDSLDSAMAFYANGNTGESVTPRQARIALLRAGMLDAVNQAVASNQEWAITWEFATEVKRDDPMIAAVQELLGKTDADIDALFIEASQL